MDGSVSPKLDSKGSPKELRPEISHASKKRKVKEKIVVTVRIGTNNAGKLLKNEGAPPDSWSWRKYGQKSIKGSPYPRGYYRCSTSKGCSAKKQVERCKTDESLLIITYTSSHNHPGPDISSTTMSNLTKSSKQPQENDDQNHDHLIDHHDNHDNHDLPLSPPKEEEEEEQKDKNEEEEHFNYIQSPIRYSQDIVIGVEEEDPFKGKKEKTTILCDTGVVGGGGGGGGFLLNEEPILINNSMQSSHTTTTTTTTHHQLMCFSSSTPKNISELENDFFDELEELPTSSSLFTSFMRSHLSDEIRIPLVPS